VAYLHVSQLGADCPQHEPWDRGLPWWCFSDHDPVRVSVSRRPVWELDDPGPGIAVGPGPRAFQRPLPPLALASRWNRL